MELSLSIIKKQYNKLLFFLYKCHLFDIVIIIYNVHMLINMFHVIRNIYMLNDLNQ